MIRERLTVWKAAAYFSAVSHEADWEWLWKDDEEIRHTGCSPDNIFKMHPSPTAVISDSDRSWKITHIHFPSLSTRTTSSYAFLSHEFSASPQ